jgi:hypothetical protein
MVLAVSLRHQIPKMQQTVATNHRETPRPQPGVVGSTDGATQNLL